MSSLFTFHGTVGPLPYLLSGVLAFALKYIIDRTAAALLVHRPWLPWQYLSPVGTTASLLSLDPADRRFLLIMSLIAMPFIWFGIALTVRRLRSMRAPAALIIFFFIPFVNLLFFLLLSLIPAQRASDPIRSQSSRGRDAALAIAISIPVCTAAIALAAKISTYGMGLFVALPFCLGLMTVLVYTRRGPRPFWECAKVAMGACVVAASALLLFPFEGAICLLMASPLVLLLAILGAMVGYLLQPQTYSSRELTSLLLLLAFYPPAMTGSESLAPQAIPEFAVRTTVDVNAPPSRVWQYVVSFSQIPEPDDWLFLAGIAYPIRAEIHGRGPGAIRHCVFSTGPFVEPITVWDEPRLLEFSVTHNPSPLREWSPYADLHPPHLDGFLVSHKGRFLLTPLPGGRTRLEGVTWYVHSLWPASYWRLWSDFIIHRIHLRVLNHVKQAAEYPPATRRLKLASSPLTVVH